MTTIKLKNGSGAPTTSDLVQGEPALDLTNKRLYTENASGAIIEVGTNPSTLTVDTNTLVVDATNNRVGVGTASPARILHVENDGLADLLLRDTSSYSVGTGPAVLFQGKDSGGTTTQFGAIYGVSNGSNSGELTFETRNSGSSAERMRIDSSGNVGIGTDSPPSTNNYKYLAVHAPTNAYLRLTNNTTGSTSSDGFDVVVSGVDAALINREAGAVKFHTSDTERMRIDSSGNVGIGTTSPNELLHIHENSSDGSWLRVTNSTTGAVGANGLLVGINSAEEANILNYSATALKFSTSATERMRIDSSGHVILNQSAGSSDNTLLRITGGTAGYSTLNLGDTDDSNVGNIQYNHSTNTLAFDVNNSERMRIDSSGNLLVGRSNINYGYGTAGAFILSTGQIQTEVAGACLALNNTSGTGTATIISLSRGNSGAGGIASSVGGTPSFVSASDVALKENIQDHGSELNNVMAIQTRVWDWKDKAKGSGEGVVAQELEQTGWADLVSEGAEGYKQVSGLGAVEIRLIKAMQEQQAMIEELKTEVAALKGE